jgi:putative DNA-invertase from lambdoid prophage Rac
MRDRLSLEVCHEAMDTLTSMGRAMFHIAGAFADLEREIIREHVKAGLANARRRGRNVGRPRAMVNVVRVQEMASQGLSGRSIAKVIGVSGGDGAANAAIKRDHLPEIGTA